MICPICGNDNSREWKHCCRDKVIICAHCCKSCDYHMNSTLGGLRCRWTDDRMTAERIKEINQLNKRIERTEQVIKVKRKMGWHEEDSLALLENLKHEKAELESRKEGSNAVF